MGYLDVSACHRNVYQFHLALDQDRLHQWAQHRISSLMYEGPIAIQFIP